MRLGYEHAFFGGSTAWAFLAADFFDTGTFRSCALFANRFDFVEEKFAGEETVKALVAGFLAFDLEAGWPMDEHHTSRGLVDVLAAVSTGADEGFFDVGFLHAEGRHALGKLRFFIR
jgi:hypothetical protein